MPRYYFNVRFRSGSEGLAVDPEGEDHPNLNAAREHAVSSAREMIARDRLDIVSDWSVCSFEIENVDAQVIATVPFDELVAEVERNRLAPLRKAGPPVELRR